MSELNKLLEIITEVKNEMEKIDPSIKERLDYLNESLSESGDIIARREEFDRFMPRTSLKEAEERAKEGATRTYTIHEIPLIPISELGWANNEDGAEGETQRSVLENWLKGIEGNDFQDKLNNVTIRMKEGFGDIPKSGDLKEYIREVMSYLVFLKTLTMAITNFNPSAAGFNFEAFLSALMGGEQIAAQGAKTIADFTAQINGETVPVSLKLYTKLKVGGSFFDLSNDLISPKDAWSSWASNPVYEGGAMRYVVCDKQFEEGVKGDPLTKKGNVNFYQFDISRANLFELFAAAGKKTQGVITSERGFMERLAAWDQRGRPGTAPFVGIKDKEGNVVALPAKSAKGDPNELADKFAEYLVARAAPVWVESGLTAEQAENLTLNVRNAYEAYLETSDKAGEMPTTAFNKAIEEIIPEQELRALLGKRQHAVSGLRKDTVDPTFKKFKEDIIKKADVRGQAISALDWVFGSKQGPELVEWYGALSSEAKAMAIQNTRGYLVHGEWEIPEMAAKRMGGTTPFAVLPIGAPFVQDMLNNVRNEVMTEVFDIFEQMAEMSKQLNLFFAKGLKQPEEAKAGAKAGETAAMGAREFAK